MGLGDHKAHELNTDFAHCRKGPLDHILGKKNVAFVLQGCLDPLDHRIHLQHRSHHKRKGRSIQVLQKDPVNQEILHDQVDLAGLVGRGGQDFLFDSHLEVLLGLVALWDLAFRHLDYPFLPFHLVSLFLLVFLVVLDCLGILIFPEVLAHPVDQGIPAAPAHRAVP